MIENEWIMLENMTIDQLHEELAICNRWLANALREADIAAARAAEVTRMINDRFPNGYRMRMPND